MRIVITGASGNVGSAVVRRLAGEGQHQLVGVVRRPPALTGAFEEVEWASLDLTRDDGALHDAFRGADAVVHLA